MKPITQETKNKWEKLQAEAGKYEEEILNRIDYVITTIFKIFNQKLNYWYFYGAGEGSVGDLSRGLNEDTVDVVTELARDAESKDMIVILKDGSEWGFEGEFPSRFLFEDFEQEVIDGKKKYEEQELARKLKAKEKRGNQKVEDKSLLASAKSKLSKKELAALRRNL